MKAWGRKFLFVMLCFAAALTMLAVGKMSGTEFVTSLLGLAGLYIGGNVLENKGVKNVEGENK